MSETETDNTKTMRETETRRDRDEKTMRCFFLVLFSPSPVPPLLSLSPFHPSVEHTIIHTCARALSHLSSV
jgi:hypothetical protein